MAVPFTDLEPVAGNDLQFYRKQSAQLLYQIVTGAVTISTANGGSSGSVADIEPLPSDVSNPHRLLFKRVANLYAIVSGQVTIPVA